MLKKLKKLFPLNALVISVATGCISLISIYTNVHFFIPGTNALSDAREIFNSIGAAISGPIGGFIIGTISCLIAPSDEIKLYSMFQHWMSAIWIGWAYKNLVYEKLKMPYLVLGWVFLIIIYYGPTYIPGYFTTYFFFPNVYQAFVGGDLPPLETLLKLYHGWIPEIVFTTIYTSLAIIAIPQRFRKPQWGENIIVVEKGKKEYQFSGILGKYINKNYLAIRLTVWFILLFTIPLVFISIFTRNFFLDYFLKAEAQQQIESIDRIERMLEISENKSIEIHSIIENINKTGTRVVLLVNDSFKLISREGDNELNKHYKLLFSPTLKQQILGKSNGSYIDDVIGFAVAYKQIRFDNNYIISFSPPGKYNHDLQDFANLITRNLGITLLIISLITGFVIWILVGKPLKRLSLVTERIGKGEYDFIASSPDLIDEVLILGNTIDEMKINIQKAQSELSNSEYKFRMLFETANDAILILENNILVDCNKKSEELFQRTRLDIINKKFHEFSAEFQADGEFTIDFAERYIGKALNGFSQFFEWDIISPSGNVINTEISLNRINIGDRVLIQAILRNITERKQYEQQLIEAKNEAEKADRLKSEFLAQISHEIRTPLHIILSNLSIIKEELGEQITLDLIKYLDNARNASNRMTRTIELIISMAEIKVGAYKPSFKNFDLVNDVLKDLVAEFSILAQSKNLSLELNIKTDNTQVFCDKNSLISIISNLIDNAIKFTSTGKVEIEVAYYDNQYILIKVLDTGKGISKEYLPEIFNIFSQEEQGIGRSFDGNGLGLAITKKYCDNNGIKISIESEKGRGSIFSLLIPKTNA